MNKDLVEMSKTPVEKKSIQSKLPWKMRKIYILTIYQVELLALALDWIARIKVLDKLEELRKQPKIEEKRMRWIRNAQELADSIVDIMTYADWLERNNKLLSEKLSQQALEVKQLQAENAKHKALQTNIAKLWTKEVRITVEEMAKRLWMSRVKLFKELKYRSYLKLNNEPYASYLNKLFVLVDTSYMRGNKKTNYKQTMITERWIKFFTNLFNQKMLQA